MGFVRERAFDGRSRVTSVTKQLSVAPSRVPSACEQSAQPTSLFPFLTTELGILMDFALTEEQQLIKAMAREFAQTKVAPIAAEIDQNRRFPSELIPELRELNLLGVPFPEEYGGAGADFLSYVLVIEELAKACASTAVIVSTHTCLCVWPIYKFGNETQKKEYLPRLTSGEWLGAFRARPSLRPGPMQPRCGRRRF